MRLALENLVKSAICIKCQLPNVKEDIDKTTITTGVDYCLYNNSSLDLSRIIYNGIVEYAKNEFDIDYTDLSKEQTKIIARHMKYDRSASQSAKLKYGFYGEVLLDLILRTHFSTSVVLARGYLYSPIENAEAKGFDAFHMIEDGGEVNLWLGEAKFYQNYQTPINDVLEKIHISLSDGYLNRNIYAIFDESEHMTYTPGPLKTIVDSWEQNPSINISAELTKHNISIVYPIMIAHGQCGTDYFDDIHKCVTYVNNKVQQLSIKIPASFSYSIFFVFLPTGDVKSIKEKVIEWIENNEPLI